MVSHTSAYTNFQNLAFTLIEDVMKNNWKKVEFDNMKMEIERAAQGVLCDSGVTMLERVLVTKLLGLVIGHIEFAIENRGGI